MDQDSPGHHLFHDDIELNHFPQQKPFTNADDISDVDVSSSDDDSVASEHTAAPLLPGWEGSPNTPSRLAKRFRLMWPQTQSIVVESAPTLLLTTISLLFTGELLDKVSRWRAMREVDQLIMIIPVVLNLKGNLEMNLSARLGTAANVGELDDPKVRNAMIRGNLFLLQFQAAVVSFVAACVSLILGRFVPRTETPVEDVATLLEFAARSVIIYPRRPMPHPAPDAQRISDLPTFTMVASTAMSATCLSGMLLGSFMCALIVLCRKFDHDPDNIAPAIASCLGDLTTLCLLGLVSTLLFPYLHTAAPLVLAITTIIWALFCLVMTLRNKHVRPLIGQGWSPLLGAMIISSGTGIVLDLFVSRYQGFALLAIVISGLPGAAGSIYVSRLSTALHAAALNGQAYMARVGPEPSSNLAMITLLLITLPVEVIFLSILHLLGWVKMPFVFMAFSVLFFCCTVLSSLIIARTLTTWLWSKGRDPDMYALPIHSALMDLIGQLLLVLCYEIVTNLGVKLRVKN